MLVLVLVSHIKGIEFMYGSFFFKLPILVFVSILKFEQAFG
jgi:hypothetical protein